LAGAAAAGIATRLGNHSFRATGITAYLKNGGTLEKASAMANHASTRTTQLYDRRRDEVSLDEVERIVILASAMRSPIPFNPTPEMAEMRPMAAVR
jgi:integrase